ncbi:Protein-lysine N-methyltransferase efm5 [Malassezia yamatoensis]|uniref:Protein-lysine N-methyltransferase efm5 n=1 Tax=Malassezia yamatoensis TaxID=253288 RepID=A0AAJ5YTZ3_9BASI|nr:Protein-lysine N-methyltransferase efm5 [Malassezia yamatoensis]
MNLSRAAVSTPRACQAGGATRSYMQDVTVKRRTGVPMVGRGPYGMGRNSVSGSVATVFGCTGFFGRYVVSKLAKRGTQVVVPYRDEDEKRHLRVLGDLGQIVPLEWDIRNEKQIEECLRHSDIVYNLTGRNYETKNFSFHDVHVEGARRIAEIAQASGVARFVQMSHLCADENSPSGYLRTKALGDSAVRRSFEGATIVRPATMYGHEDRFLNKLASWPTTWKLNHGQTKMAPVHSLDVAHALAQIGYADADAIGQTYVLPGPKLYTVRELLQLVESLTYRNVLTPEINVPKWLFSMITGLGEKVAWWPMFNKDEVQRRFIDEHLEIPAGCKSWADLGIEPDVLEDVAILYLRRFRSHLSYEQPMSNAHTGAIKVKKQPYRVIE